MIVVFTLWDQIGGQSHVDAIPWQWKLLLGPGLAFISVRATAAAVDGESAWNGKTIAWITAAITLILVMGSLTYYQHLNEPPDENEPAIEHTRA
ncbi:MAG: hypothetical protein ACRD8O_06320 [Bryobacteraceae bacterium]